MPIFHVGLLSGRSLDFGKITECKSKVRWQAKSDSNFDTPQSVFQQVVGQYNLPVIPYTSLNPYVTAPTQLCRGVSCEQDSGAPRRWIIEGTYSSEPLKSSDEEQAENPLNRPPSVKWSSQAYQTAIFRDINGKAIVNSAGDYFDPPVEVSLGRWIVTIEKNVVAVPDQILEYNESINQSAFNIQGVGIGPQVAKLMDIALSERQTAKISTGQGQEITISYYTFSYSLELRPEGWQLPVLDQGFRYRNGGELKQITDDSSPPRPVSSPRLLNGSGGILENPGPETAVFKTFDVCQPRDFSILPGLIEAGA